MFTIPLSANLHQYKSVTSFLHVLQLTHPINSLSLSSRVISQPLYITDTPGRAIKTHLSLSLDSFRSLIPSKGTPIERHDREIGEIVHCYIYSERRDGEQRLISELPPNQDPIH